MDPWQNPYLVRGVPRNQEELSFPLNQVCWEAHLSFVVLEFVLGLLVLMAEVYRCLEKQAVRHRETTRQGNLRIMFSSGTSRVFVISSIPLWSRETNGP